MIGIGRFAKNIFNSIADAGENFLDLTGLRGTPTQKLINLSNDLLSHKGIASGMALAREVVNRYQILNNEDRFDYFRSLGKDFGTDFSAIDKASKDYVSSPGLKSLVKLKKSVKTKREELFSRMNMAPNGTVAIVDMRRDLLFFTPEFPELREVDVDLKSLLKSWFNPGFLVLKRIDWETEASILEKIIRYETVHNIESWNDLKLRLVENRRCFAFFHPALENEPIIFVEVALTKGIAESMQTVFEDSSNGSSRFDSAIFYSINNCQRGLKGIPLGNFLIKRVVAEIATELPSIKKYSSLSPVTGFSKWLTDQLDNEKRKIPGIEKELLKNYLKNEWHKDPKTLALLKKPLKKACAYYLIKEKKSGKPLNNVARFHFGNGAQLFRINWMANKSEHGISDSFGLMVNYLYDLKHIESNHENYIRHGELSVSKSVKNLL